MLADGILVRGQTTFEQCKRWNKNVILSNPLISYKYFRNITKIRTGHSENKLFEILYVGKLEENKGVQILIMAISMILQRSLILSDQIKLHIVGSGDMDKRLKSQAEEECLDGITHFHGFIDDAQELANYFSRCSVLVVPTLYHEGFPRVIDEAMSCGLPVICSRLGGMKDGLKENEVLFFGPGDVDELASAIGKIITDLDYREKLQHASRERAELTLYQTAAEQHAGFLAKL